MVPTYDQLWLKDSKMESYSIKKNTAAIILAAGKGERLATLGEKPLLKYKNKSFVEIAIKKVQKADFKPIILVINKELVNKIKNFKLNVEVVVNPHPEKGMISSIHCGLAKLDQTITGFLLNPVDFPLVEEQTYQKLLHEHQREIDCIIKPVYNGKSGHPLIFPPTVFEDLKKAPINGGARSVIKKNPHLIRILDVDDPGILININTAETYFKYCK